VVGTSSSNGKKIKIKDNSLMWEIALGYFWLWLFTLRWFTNIALSTDGFLFASSKNKEKF